MHNQSITPPLSSSVPPFISSIDLPSICVRVKKKGEEWREERRGQERGGPQPSTTPPATGAHSAPMRTDTKRGSKSN
ncbi:hypothetical protein QQF64_008672 [Cirrhinus molitorella]|uniref:Uncharacterized protein n=1 Tax=Cirrhinus molitorella TaxID=172907 RepID=A0ABR3M879_9TELE